jgi:hypothetical protein
MVEVRIPRAGDHERVVGQAAWSVADDAGFAYHDAKDLEVAACTACSGLAGRFFVGACRRVVVSFRIRPDAVRIVAFGDGVWESGTGAEMYLDAHEADICLALLRSVMDGVTMVEDQRRGLCLSMTKRR